VQPVEFSVRRIETTDGRVLRILEDFLVADRPELNSDLTIAVRVWEKGERRLSKVRYAYATTAHHAQGMTRATTVVDARTDEGRHSEGYFRWLYSAVTRATRECCLFAFQELDALDQATWGEAGTETHSIPVAGGWSFRQLLSTPNGDSRTRAIGSALSAYLPSGCNVEPLNSSSYQEQFRVFRHSEPPADLIVHYNGEDVVTQIRPAKAGTIDDLLMAIAENAAADAVPDGVGAGIINAVRDRADRAGLRIVGAKRDAYCIHLVLSGRETLRERAAVELHHGKDGVVTTARLVKYTDSQIREKVRSVFAARGRGGE
jgi:hypothetical protein